jgi:hypothetical protein
LNAVDTLSFDVNDNLTLKNTASIQRVRAFSRGVGSTDGIPLPIFGGVVTGLGGTGNPTAGQTVFNTAQIFGAPPGLTCLNCHSGITGTNRNVDIPAPGGEPQNRKNAPLRDVWRKVGANRASTTALRGFGFDHNGEDSTLQDVLNIGFRFTAGATGVTQRRDVEAFLLSFGTETHAGVGQQTTANGVSNDTTRINQFIAIANTNAVGLIAKGRINGIVRGFTYQGGSFITDRATEPALSPAALLALAAAGSEITYTLVPAGSQTRLGVDRDLDTFRDRDELDAGSDPSNAASVPHPCIADVSPSIPDGLVNGADLAVILTGWGGPGVSDLDGNGTTDASDLAIVLSSWGICH